MNKLLMGAFLALSMCVTAPAMASTSPEVMDEREVPPAFTTTIGGGVICKTEEDILSMISESKGDCFRVRSNLNLRITPLYWTVVENDEGVYNVLMAKVEDVMSPNSGFMLVKYETVRLKGEPS